MYQFHQNRADLLRQIATGMITNESAPEKNFMLGKIELLNDILDEDFYQDLIESLQGGIDE